MYVSHTYKYIHIIIHIDDLNQLGLETSRYVWLWASRITWMKMWSSPSFSGNPPMNPGLTFISKQTFSW